MARFVPDIKTQRWVVISPTRAKRPHEEKEKPENGCAFCYGGEKLTPPEVFRWGTGMPNESGWEVRVVPNLFPITDIHEVIIHSPDHNKDINELTNEQVEIIFKVYRQRYQNYHTTGHVLIFNNHGKEAGASLAHPHSQLVVIPRQIKLDTLNLEPMRNIVSENTLFTTFCPDFSQWPYEAWIVPKRSGETFSSATDEELKHLSEILKVLLAKLLKKFPDLNYNYYIYPSSDWYLRIMPRLSTRAGFELGTGLSVNTIDPIEAAEELRKI